MYGWKKNRFYCFCKKYQVSVIPQIILQFCIQEVTALCKVQFVLCICQCRQQRGWNPLTNCGLDTEPADAFTSKISVYTLMRSLLKINDYLRGNHWQKKCLFSVKFTLIGMIPMLSCLKQEEACCVYIYCVLFNLLYSLSVLYTHIPHVWLSVFRFSNVTVFGNLKRLILQVFLLLLFKKSCFLPFYVRITAGIHAISICFMQM